MVFLKLVLKKYFTPSFGFTFCVFWLLFNFFVESNLVKITSCKYYEWIPNFMTWCVTTLTLGSRAKQRLTRVRAKREARESPFMLLGMEESVREWTLTPPSEFPLWELESWWTSKFLESDCRGSEPIGLKSYLYDWKALET